MGHTRSTNRMAEKVRFDTLDVDVTDGVITIKGKCGQAFQMDSKDWKKLQEAIAHEFEIDRKATEKLKRQEEAKKARQMEPVSAYRYSFGHGYDPFRRNW